MRHEDESNFNAAAASALTLLALLFGVQLIRVFIPMVGIYLQFTAGMSTMELLPYALVPFLLGLAVPLLLMVLKPRYALAGSALTLGIARLVEQVASEPAIDLWATIVGVVALLCLLPLLLGMDRRSFAFGVLLGLTADTALRGLTGTLDLSWISGPWPLVLVVGLLGAYLYALTVVLRIRVRLTSAGFRASVPLFGVGPLLFMHLLILQNQGWVSQVTGWSWGPALALIALGNVAAMTLAASVLSKRPVWAPALAAAVFAGVALLADAAPPVAGSLIFLALAATGAFLASVVGPDVKEEPRSNLTTAGLFLGAGNLAFILLVFLYYAPLGTPLPLTHDQVRLAGGALLALAALSAYAAPSGRRSVADYRPALAAVLGLLVPLGMLVQGAAAVPREDPADGYPVQAMTFNVRWGYGTAGRQTLPEIADQIEDSGTDVVGFQEISRGQLYSGSTDMVAWLSRRLDMPYVAFLPTLDDDPLWGLAVISRYPIRDRYGEILPTFGNLIQRGFLETRLDLGQGEELLLITTHLNHPTEGFERRPERLTEEHFDQLDIILGRWADRPRTVFLGDMNALPDWPEVDHVRQAGFQDAWDAGAGPGYTHPASDARYRIDYVFHTPDLVAREAEVMVRQNSDHLAVVATVDLRR